MVNATIDPFLDVPSQVVRYRVLNGSSQRTFNLGLSNNQSFYQIASDGGLLSAPLQLTRLLLSPGERAEILIDFSGMNGQTAYLKSYASELQNGIYGAKNPGMGAGMTMNGYNPNTLNGTNFNIIKFNIGNQTANPISTIPSNLVTVTPIPEINSDITRNLTFSPVTMGPNQLNGDFLINGATMDLNVINYTIPFNNTEIWELTNQSAISHPFHIHDVQFYILTRNGVAPQPSEQGRKDVVLVKPQETVRFIAKFETFSNETVPYMYHCHLLTHEDGGMMGQFIVSNPLPVEGLEPLSARLDGNQIRLFWATEMEQNNKGFGIQRSADGVVWSEIGWTEGKGSTHLPNSYRVVDQSPLVGVNYYRYEQVDYDGQSTFSNVVSVMYQSLNNDVRLAPNPAINEITILSNSIDRIERVVIQTLTGKTIKVFGSDTKHLNISDLNSGTYIVYIQMEKTITKRMLIIK